MATREQQQEQAISSKAERKLSNRASAIAIRHQAQQQEREEEEEEEEEGSVSVSVSVSTVKKSRGGETRHPNPCRMVGAVPFQWEKEPGKPKLDDPQTPYLPPLSPPPNRFFSSSSSFPTSFPSSSSSSVFSGSSHGHHSWASSPKAMTRKVMHMFNKTFLRKSNLNLNLNPAETGSPPPPPALKRSISTKLNLPALIRPKSKSHNIAAAPDHSQSQPGSKHDLSFSPPKIKSIRSFSQPLVKSYPPSSLPRPSTSSSASSNSSSMNLDLSLSSSSSSFRSGPVEPTHEYAPKKVGFPTDGNSEDLYGHSQYSQSYNVKSPYTASDMRTYSNPSSPLITVSRGGRRVNHSGPVNPCHYELALKGSSFSSKKVADEYAQDHHTTFAEVVAASALMFGPPDDYAASDNSSFGCLPSRSHVGRNPHGLWHVINV